MRKATGILLLCFVLAACASQHKRLQKQRESDPEYQYDVGTIHLGSNKPDEAIKYFSRSLRLDPRNPLVYNGLGLAYLLKNQHGIAERYFMKCLEVSPEFSEAHNNLGMVYQETKQFQKAEHEFRRAADDINYGSGYLAFYNLARLYYIQEKHQEALTQVQSALKLKEDFGLGFNLEGVLHDKLGSYDKAIISYKSALKSIPRDINLSYSLAVAYFNNRQLELAKQVFEGIYPDVDDVEMKIKIDEYLKEIRKQPGLSLKLI